MAIGDSLIQVRDLKKYYNRGAIKALDGVTVDIDRGDVMVVIGPSGSGKSTFLRIRDLLEMPTGGSIIFNGVDITKKKMKNEEGKTVKVDIDQHRQKMGMVFQHFNLFPHMTIMDNMTLAPVQVKHMDKAEAEKKAQETREQVSQWLTRVEAGYDRLRTDVDATISHASGELERVARSLEHITAEFAEHDTALEKLLQVCREGEPPKAPSPLTEE